MNEAKTIWMNGELVKWHDAKVHVLTHTLHYGMGVFEGIRFYKTSQGTAVFRLREHIERMMKGAKTCFMEITFTEDQLVQAVIDTIKSNELDEGYIRPIVYYGYGKMGLDPKGAPTDIAIAVWPWGSYLGEDAVKVKTSSFFRIHPGSTHADAKICGHYVNSIFASVEAKHNGFDEALLLDYEGYVAEGPGENIFVVKNNEITTPCLTNVLPGITRKSVISIAENEKIQCHEKKLTIEDVYNADEVFFTGTAAEIAPIASVDDKSFKLPGQVTMQFKEIFSGIVHGKNKKYEDWLTYC